MFIISADHGHIDINEHIEIYNNKELMELLKVGPYLEPRATAYIVKDGKQKEFKKLFNKCYGKDFKLLKSKKILDKNYFGLTDGENAKLLGDFISVGKNNKMFLLTKGYPRFNGHHTSLGKEMLVPLIMYSTKGE